MCNAASALVLQGAGAASSAIGAYSSAQASKTSLNLTADLADINARMSESAAQATLLSGQREVQRSQLATAGLKGKQRASMAANGVDLGEGSAAQVLTSTDVLGEVDANTLEANAVRSAWGYRVQGTNATNQALVSRAAAGAINPGQAAMTSLLGSAGTVASKWYGKGDAAAAPAASSFGPRRDSFFFKSNRGSGD